MSYVLRTVKAGRTIEKKKYYSFRFNNGGTRGKREKETPEAQKRLNQKKAGDRLRWLMNTNFEDGDLLVTLSFHLHPPNDSKEMQSFMSKAIRKMRRINPDLKYIYVKEIGERGAKHAHALIKGLTLEQIKSCWEYGTVQGEILYTEGQYRKIAEYFIKYALKTEKTEGRLIGKRWYSSQNLEKPKITRKRITARQFRAEASVPKGYYLEKDSELRGISEFTGYEYYTYTVIKTRGEPHGS